MAEENLILIRTETEEPHMAVFLFPKTEHDLVRRNMALPDSYTHLFSMSKMRRLADGGHSAPNGFLFVDRSVRGPFNFPDKIQQLLRTHWMGKAGETIDREIEQFQEMMARIKGDSVRPSFPVTRPEGSV